MYPANPATMIIQMGDTEKAAMSRQLTTGIQHVDQVM